MKMARVVRWSWSVVAFGAIFACSSGPAADPDRPNVVIILADDLGYADLGCFGAEGIRTRNLDRLAAEGTRFTNFLVSQAVCTASRAALLTGCYPNRVGMAGALNHTSPQGIHPDERLLSELVRARGYTTAAYGKWHLGLHPPFWPTRRGFDEFFGIPYSNDNGPLHPTVRTMPPLPLYEGDDVVEIDPDQSQFTRRFTERAVRFIAAHRNEPFLLYVPHVMPHVPIFASEAWRGKNAGGPYGDVVQELDWSVGEIMAALTKHDLDDHTLDLFTTLVALTGAAPPTRKTDGLDLRPLLFGAEGSRGRETLWYYSGDELQAVRKGNWKLHLPHEYLTVDPGESHDVAANHPEVVADLEALAAAAGADLGDSLADKKGPGVRQAGDIRRPLPSGVRRITDIEYAVAAAPVPMALRLDLFVPEQPPAAPGPDNGPEKLAATHGARLLGGPAFETEEVRQAIREFLVQATH